MSLVNMGDYWLLGPATWIRFFFAEEEAPLVQFVIVKKIQNLKTIEHFYFKKPVGTKKIIHFNKQKHPLVSAGVLKKTWTQHHEETQTSEVTPNSGTHARCKTQSYFIGKHSPHRWSCCIREQNQKEARDLSRVPQSAAVCRIKRLTQRALNFTRRKAPFVPTCWHVRCRLHFFFLKRKTVCAASG